jgi:hypothetical protein
MLRVVAPVSAIEQTFETNVRSELPCICRKFKCSKVLVPAFKGERLNQPIEITPPLAFEMKLPGIGSGILWNERTAGSYEIFRLIAPIPLKFVTSKGMLIEAPLVGTV